MSDAADLARGWLLKGDSDRLDAERGLASAGPWDTTCFHTQQAAEKYLKAVLAFTGHPIPRTHDLVVIYEVCVPIAPALRLDRAELAVLTPHAVQLRYDTDFWPDLTTAQEAAARWSGSAPASTACCRLRSIPDERIPPDLL